MQFKHETIYTSNHILNEIKLKTLFFQKDCIVNHLNAIIHTIHENEVLVRNIAIIHILYNHCYDLTKQILL